MSSEQRLRVHFYWEHELTLIYTPRSDKKYMVSLIVLERTLGTFLAVAEQSMSVEVSTKTVHRSQISNSMERLYIKSSVCSVRFMYFNHSITPACRKFYFLIPDLRRPLKLEYKFCFRYCPIISFVSLSIAPSSSVLMHLRWSPFLSQLPYFFDQNFLVIREATCTWILE